MPRAKSAGAVSVFAREKNGAWGRRPHDVEMSGLVPRRDDLAPVAHVPAEVYGPKIPGTKTRVLGMVPSVYLPFAPQTPLA